MKSTNRLKAINAIKWIDELAVTKEKQGKHRLGSPNKGFCCLGLGCHILNIGFFENQEIEEDFTQSVGLLDYSGSLSNTAEGYRNYFFETRSNSLTELNDDENYDFYQISEEIKKNVILLFEPEVANLLIKHYNLTTE